MYRKEDAMLLEQKLKKASNFYYQGISIMSDQEFDDGVRKLRRIYEENPSYKNTKTTILNKIGSKPDQTTFATVLHPKKMYSMNDVFSYSDVEKFTEKYSAKVLYSVEPKIDGASLLAIYRNGDLYRAETRGDGLQGDDITLNAQTFMDLPLKIANKHTLYVHGEVYITKKDFDVLQEERIKSGLDKFQNARNAAAGSMKLKDANEVRRRKLRFIAFALENAVEKGFNSHTESLNFLKEQGFNVVDYEITTNPVTSIAQLGLKRESLPFNIDGAAVKIDDLSMQQTIGYTAKYPKWAVAFKYPAETVETTLRDIVYQVGRTGIVTPVAKFDTVRICETNVSSATLNNERFISALDLHEGDILSISKAGDIIPEIIAAKRGQINAKRIVFATHCPKCNSLLQYEGSRKKCANTACSARNLMAYIHFCDKPCMNIVGFGEKMLTKMIDGGLLDKEFNLISLYSVSAEQLKTLDGVKERSANRMRMALDRAMTQDLCKVIRSLGIPHVGEVASKEIEKHFVNLENFINTSFEELVSIDRISSVCASEILMYLNDVRDSDNIQFLLGKKSVIVDGVERTFKVRNKQTRRANGKLNDLTFAITGTFAMRRSEVGNLIEANGGNIASAVSSRVDYLIAGNKSGKKKAEAIKQGVEIITLDDLMSMI